jgi:hypothetical protein
MPKKTKGPKLLPDVPGGSNKVVRAAVGQAPVSGVGDRKDKAAQSLGKRGGQARAKALSPERRADIARQAAATRWGKREE